MGDRPMKMPIKSALAEHKQRKFKVINSMSKTDFVIFKAYRLSFNF